MFKGLDTARKLGVVQDLVPCPSFSVYMAAYTALIALIASFRANIEEIREL